MDPSSAQTTPAIEEDEWDTDGFVIPSLGIEVLDRVTVSPVVEDSKQSAQQPRKEENIYLGPHGAPPSQAKQQERNLSGNRQRFKQKLKEADKRYSGTGRENKVDNLREFLAFRVRKSIFAFNKEVIWCTLISRLRFANFLVSAALPAENSKVDKTPAPPSMELSNYKTGKSMET